jgi:hypothetical protein
MEAAMNFVKWSMLVLGLFVAGSAGAETPRVERYEGVAETPSGEFLYREKHEVTENGGVPVRALTVYYDRAGREIGRLSSDFRGSPYAPAYRFEDGRTGQKESATVARDSLQLAYRGERKTLTVPGNETLVVGQGLHHFARMNLPRLAREEVTVRFAVPSRLDTYGFRIRPLASPAPGVVRLRIEIESWLLRQLAPHLEVDYELKTRRLLKYRGVSNLDAADGGTQKVVIRYSYPRASS